MYIYICVCVNAHVDVDVNGGVKMYLYTYMLHVVIYTLYCSKASSVDSRTLGGNWSSKLMFLKTTL